MPARWFVFSAALLCASVCGCVESEDAASTDPPIPVAEADEPETDSGGAVAPSSGPRERELGGIRFTIPEDWQEQQLSGVRSTILDAAYRVPKTGDELEITFSTVGGGIAGNVDRWIGQFESAPGEEALTEGIQVGGTSATWVDVRGTFSGAMSGGSRPRDSWRLLGVAIPREDRDYYVKLTGPQVAVAEVYEEFRSAVQAARLSP